MTDKQWCFDNPEEAAELINKLTEERDGLKAQVNQSQQLLRIWQTWLGSDRDSCDDTGMMLWDKIEECCETTPEHCLTEIKAKATKDGFVEALLIYTDEPKEWCMDKVEQNQKISEILRRQSKENNP